MADVETYTAVHTDYMGRPLKGHKPVVVHQVSSTEVRDGNEVPDDASVEGVWSWVHHGNVPEGYDPDRAKAALTAEHSRGHSKKSGGRLAPRKSLIARLTKRLEEGQTDG